MDPNIPNSQTPPPAPPAWGQQPPAWNAAPAPKSRSFLSGIVGRIVGFVVVIAVLAIAGIVYVKVVNPDHRGQVIFTTSNQQANDNCKITDRVSTIKAGDSVYVMVMWAHKMSADEKVVEEDFKNGTSLGTTDWTTSDYAGFDCTTVTQDLKDVFAEAGTYEIKLSVGKDVVADGTLNVTAP